MNFLLTDSSTLTEGQGLSLSTALLLL